MPSHSTSQAYLEGVRVLDLSRLLPGPFCTQLLADAGADVIKIEAPQGGDYARHYPPYLDDTGVGAFFDAINRGKKSVALDLRTSQGRELCEALIARSDVLVESFRPGVMARLGLDIEGLRARHPGLIICSITGYGQHGPHAHRAGHDINYLARTGLLWETRPRGTSDPVAPVIPGFQAADIAGGSLQAAFGIVSALFRRTRTGQGAYLDVSMTEGALGMHVGLHANLQHVPELAHHNLLAGDLPGYSIYRAACGGYVAVGALEPKFWTELVKLLDLPHLEHDGASVGERGEAARAEVAQKMASKTREEWTAIFEAHDVCCDPVLSPLEALEQEMHHARGSFFQVGGVRYTTGSALGVVEGARRRAPLLGEHTRACLEELVSDPEHLDALWEAGVLGGPRQE